MYTPKDKHSNVIKNSDKVVIVCEEFYTDLYSILDIQGNTELGSSSEQIDIPPVTKEVKEALNGIQGSKAIGEDQITAGLLNDGGQVVL